MNLLFFTLFDGEKIGINPEYVAMVHCISEGTVITFSSDSILRVRESFDNVVATLNAWRKKA